MRKLLELHIFAIFFHTLLCSKAADDLDGTHENHILKRELEDAKNVIQNLLEANKSLRKQLQASSTCLQYTEQPHHKGWNDFSNQRHSMSEIDINGWIEEESDKKNEFIYGLPSRKDIGDINSGHLNGQKIVIELGANNGEWINAFLSMNSDFWPMIVEAQPSYRNTLREIAMEYRGIYLQKAAWIENRNMTFYSHTDAGGMGSSLFDDSVYRDGWCGGQLHCNDTFGVAYQVEAIDIVDYIRRIARREDHVVLRMDIEGAEYEVARRLVMSGVACDLIDYWEMEGHAMGWIGDAQRLCEQHAVPASNMRYRCRYSASNMRYRPVDGVLPWLLRSCGVKMVTYQYYKVARLVSTWAHYAVPLVELMQDYVAVSHICTSTLPSKHSLR